MKILISVSTSKGDKVIIKYKNNEWYVGTIKAVTRDGKTATVLYNEGSTEKVLISKCKPVLVKGKKGHYTNEEAKKLIDAYKPVKPKPVVIKQAKPKPTVKPVVKPEEKPISPAPTSPEPQEQPDLNRQDNSEEKSLEHKVGDKELFKKTATPEGKLRYIKHVWTKANDLLFESKLKIPKLGLMKNVKNFRGYGYWRVATRELMLSPRLFNASQAQCITVIIHEQCHQAVSEIDKVYDKTAGGHGPNWCAWMRHCGLSPSRYNHDDRQDYMTEDEIAEHQAKLKKRREAEQKRQQIAINEERMPIAPNNNQPAQYLDTNTDTWVKGLIACPNDQSRKRWAFVTEPFGTSYRIIPSEWFWSIPTEEHMLYMDKFYMEKAQKIRDHLQRKKDMRQIRRNFRKGW